MKRSYLLAATAASLLAFSAGAQQQPQGKTGSDTYRQLNLFGEVFERVRADYVEDVTDE